MLCSYRFHYYLHTMNGKKNRILTNLGNFSTNINLGQKSCYSFINLFYCSNSHNRIAFLSDMRMGQNFRRRVKTVSLGEGILKLTIKLRTKKKRPQRLPLKLE